MTIKINKITPQTVKAFGPNKEFLGFVNEYELTDLRIQIKVAGVSGYYLEYYGYDIPILPSGAIENWPKGFFDLFDKQLNILLDLN